MRTIHSYGAIILADFAHEQEEKEACIIYHAHFQSKVGRAFRI